MRVGVLCRTGVSDRAVWHFATVAMQFPHNGNVVKRVGVISSPANCKLGQRREAWNLWVTKNEGRKQDRG